MQMRLCTPSLALYLVIIFYSIFQCLSKSLPGFPWFFVSAQLRLWRSRTWTWSRGWAPSSACSSSSSSSARWWRPQKVDLHIESLLWERGIIFWKWLLRHLQQLFLLVVNHCQKSIRVTLLKAKMMIGDYCYPVIIWRTVNKNNCLLSSDYREDRRWSQSFFMRKQLVGSLLHYKWVRFYEYEDDGGGDGDDGNDFFTVSEFIFIIIIFSSEIMKYFSGVDDPFVGNTTLHNGGFNIVQTKVKLWFYFISKALSVSFCIQLVLY